MALNAFIVLRKAPSLFDLLLSRLHGGQFPVSPRSTKNPARPLRKRPAPDDFALFGCFAKWFDLWFLPEPRAASESKNHCPQSFCQYVSEPEREGGAAGDGKFQRRTLQLHNLQGGTMGSVDNAKSP